MSKQTKLLDLLIVGAGISGISAACYLSRRQPDKTCAILEARDHIGGTWDLFRYPGIRSDSDMHTFGFDFKPWTDPKVLADGPSILAYLQEAIEEYGIGKKIRFGTHVEAANWSDEEALWTVTARQGDGSRVTYRARVLFMCSGYYNYAHGYTPELPGLDSFKGSLVHPQHWPRALDYAGKRIAVIGSGATAVTLVPAMADQAALVTMIQRSPTWIVSRPGEDWLARLANRFLPVRLAYRLVRWRNIRFQNYVYSRARQEPEKLRAQLLKLLHQQLDDESLIERHFTPTYNPWDQRLCLVPDGDLFKAINAGKAKVVTGQIERITETGVQMQSGEHVDADILITATGLELQFLGGVAFTLDGEPIDFSGHPVYQGLMLAGIPNLVFTFGYINASWTLRADLNSRFVCDMFAHLDRTGAVRFVPTPGKEELPWQTRPFISDFNPGYMQRGLHRFPPQGQAAPWCNSQNYLADRKAVKRGLAGDPALRFS